jgi:hypothetical protein
MVEALTCSHERRTELIVTEFHGGTTVDVVELVSARTFNPFLAARDLLVCGLVS